MTSTKGIAKGGSSWIHPKNEMTVKRNFEDAEPSNWLGFGCVVEIKN
jgi:hypothetical protein